MVDHMFIFCGSGMEKGSVQLVGRRHNGVACNPPSPTTPQPCSKNKEGKNQVRTNQSVTCKIRFILNCSHKLTVRVSVRMKGLIQIRSFMRVFLL